MGTPPPAPQGDAVPTNVPSNLSPPNGSSEPTGRRKKIGIIAGSVVGVILIVLAVLFFLPKEELPIQPAKEPLEPDTALADYLRGKRLTYVLTEDVLKNGPFAAMLGPSLTAQLAGKTVFQQFDINGTTTQFGLAIPNMTPAGSPKPGSERMAMVEKGSYSVDGLNLKITKDGGNDTVVFTKAEPVAGDEVTMKYPNGQTVKVSIVKVAPAGPLENLTMGMMGSLGLGGGPDLGGDMGALAGLLSGKGGGTVMPGKPKPKPGYQQQSGAGGAQGKPARPGKPSGGGGQIKQGQGKTQQWTFGSGQRDLSKWKGKVTNQQVLFLFGNPDKGEPWGQGGGAWTYNKMKIKDKAGKSYKSVTFYIQNGAVVDVKLPAAGGAKPKN